MKNSIGEVRKREAPAHIVRLLIKKSGSLRIVSGFAQSVYRCEVENDRIAAEKKDYC